MDFDGNSIAPEVTVLREWHVESRGALSLTERREHQGQTEGADDNPWGTHDE